MKILDLLKEFVPTLKKYINYLMKVDFKGLFVNTIIILCLILLAAFVYVPLGIVQDVLNSLLQLFIPLTGTFGLIYSLLFKIIGALLAIIVFIYLFNKRFEDIENKEKEEKREVNNKKVSKNEKDNLDLPKEKE